MDERGLRSLMKEINDGFSKQDRSINDAHKRIDKMANFASRIQNTISSKQRIEEQTAINAASFDKVNAYVNIIIFAGYAGFFAIWSFTNNQLPEKAKIWTALLVGVSLFFFVFWEVLRTWLQSASVVKAFKLSLENLEPDEYQIKEDALKEKTITQTKMIISLWRWFLFFTVIPGLAGGLLLAYNFVAVLISSIPHWPS